MSVATQGYPSPAPHDSSKMFGQSHNIAKSHGFLKTFGNGLTNRITNAQQVDQHTPQTSDMDSLDTRQDGFFDFEPPTDTASPYRDQFSTPGDSSMPWANDYQLHTLSPPDSASFSPKDSWAFGFQNPSNLVTNIDPASTRTNYGQVTPPDDDNESMLDYQFKDQQHPLQTTASESPIKKRKRNGSSTHGQPTQPPKRVRKYASRNINSSEVADKPEDVKRSKFLERNRVAASKCRQKKKEWTQSLEGRARDLQKNNNMLRMSVESLRQEVLFLKGEILEHGSCDCTQIQDFIKSGAIADTFADDAMTFKREHSPIESMPNSPSSRRHASHDDPDDSSPPAPERSNTSIVNDENALEALLCSSINHDTSDEGISKQIGG